MTAQVALAAGVAIGLALGAGVGFSWRRPKITRRTTTVVCPIRLDGREIAQAVLRETRDDDDGPARF